MSRVRFINDLVLSMVHIYVWSSWAESNDVVRSTIACKCTPFVIISIAVSVGALFMEYLRVLCRWACLWSVLRRGATILWLIECNTCAQAGNHAPIGPLLLQLTRTNCVHVRRATSRLAVASTALWSHRHGQVEAINKTNVVEILSSACWNIKFR